MNSSPDHRKAPLSSKDDEGLGGRHIPGPGSIEASQLIDDVLAEYNNPSNPKNAARAGWVAAARWRSKYGGDQEQARLSKAIETLRSIAANICCDRCQEAALVARDFLAKDTTP